MKHNFETVKEYREYLNKKHKEWMDKQPDEVKSKYSTKAWLEKQTDEVRKKYKNRLIGFCSRCNKKCKNLYTHNKSKKHMSNLNAP
jgi:ribosomal protein S17E